MVTLLHRDLFGRRLRPGQPTPTQRRPVWADLQGYELGIWVLSLQDLDELQLGHLWRSVAPVTSAAAEGNAQLGEKLQFVVLTF